MMIWKHDIVGLTEAPVKPAFEVFPVDLVPECECRRRGVVDHPPMAQDAEARREGGMAGGLPKCSINFPFVATGRAMP
jgi:hypothetical protein